MWQTIIEKHYRDVWDIEPEVCEFLAGPIGQGPVHQLPHNFAVLKFPPHGARNLWTYATRCMSSPEDAKPMELHMYSPQQTDEVVELLVVTAHFHRTRAELDVGHSVNFGRPWIGDSICQHGLISFPYLDGSKLEILSLGSRKINFYWLLPITNSEVEFKMERGLDALEREFDRSLGLEYANPHRKSVV